MFEIKPGDVFYERAHERDGNRITPFVKAWRVLSTYLDEEWKSEETGQPTLIVLLRAWTKDRAVYKSEQDWEIEVALQVGTWKREVPPDWQDYKRYPG